MKNNILLYLGILVAVIVISGCAKDIKTSELYISPSANIAIRSRKQRNTRN